VLEIVMTIITSSSDRIEMFGEIGNVSNLAATSSYVAWFEGCGEVRLDGYPRWCEPVRGLLARCLELTEPGKPLPADWVSVRVDIGLNGGGLQRQHRDKAVVQATELIVTRLTFAIASRTGH
jgi:hypothetical protein